MKGIPGRGRQAALKRSSTIELKSGNHVGHDCERSRSKDDSSTSNLHAQAPLVNCEENRVKLHDLKKEKKKLPLVRAAAEGLSGQQRKNVYKYIVRQLVQRVNRSPKRFFEYAKTQVPITQAAFCRVREKLKKLGAKEKKRSNEEFKKDYVALLNKIESSHLTFLMLIKTLQEIRDEHLHNNFGKVRPTNQNVYKRVICSLYQEALNRFRAAYLIPDAVSYSSLTHSSV